MDMAGLVSPQVIPFIRDEVKLKEWLTAGVRAMYFLSHMVPRISGRCRIRRGVFYRMCDDA